MCFRSLCCTKLQEKICRDCVQHSQQQGNRWCKQALHKYMQVCISHCRSGRFEGSSARRGGRTHAASRAGHSRVLHLSLHSRRPHVNVTMEWATCTPSQCLQKTTATCCSTSERAVQQPESHETHEDITGWASLAVNQHGLSQPSKKDSVHCPSYFQECCMQMTGTKAEVCG